jgi:hypothetical protein
MKQRIADSFVAASVFLILGILLGATLGSSHMTILR